MNDVQLIYHMTRKVVYSNKGKYLQVQSYLKCLKQGMQLVASDMTIGKLQERSFGDLEQSHIFFGWVNNYHLEKRIWLAVWFYRV